MKLSDITLRVLVGGSVALIGVVEIVKRRR